MKRFREINLPFSFNVSIEFVSDHKNSHTQIINRDLKFSQSFSDDIISLLEDEKISLDDVVTISVKWCKLFINSKYDGQSFKIVGED